MSGNFKNKTILKILDYYKNIWSLSYVSGVSHWDLETYMPRKGVLIRGEALARISTIRQKMFLDPEFVSLIESSRNLKNLNDEEKAVTRVLLRSLDFYRKVPSEFLEEIEKLTNTATLVWREAKEKDDFKIFEKDLSKIFEMNKRLAEYLGYKESAYDALLNEYEEGLTSSGVFSFFDSIKNPLKDILKSVTNSKSYFKVHELENSEYSKEKMQALNQKVLNDFWSDSDRLRLDVSSHPFTIGFSTNDTRITTWYHKKDFARSLLATIHEFGHALYDLQSNPDFEMTPISGGSSLVIHESQSRFWENFVGRSRSFIEKYKKDFEGVVGKKLDVNDLYLYFNKVSPSYLRVEADEVTYHFHIMLRAEIERDILEEKVKVKDLKELWNSKTKDYLGLTPKKDSQGILQDIHWSGGSVGYFPTYSLGTFLGAQWEEKIKSSKIKDDDYQGIKNWLDKNIHQYATTYTLNDLLKKNKMKYDPSVNLDYLKNKYLGIYKK